MLDDDTGRAGVAIFGDQFERGVGVVVIIVTELLALHLPRLADALRGRAGGGVESRLLMRVFAVTEGFATGQGK